MLRSRLVVMSLVLASCKFAEPVMEDTPAPAPAPAPAPVKPVVKAEPPPEPPTAKKEPVKSTLHGHELVDDYAWLAKKGTPEVEAYLNAENAYTEAMTKDLKPLRETLYKEMRGRIQEADTSLEVNFNGYAYFEQTYEGKQYGASFRRKLPDGKPELLIDMNAIAEKEKFAGEGGSDITDDNQVMAWSLDVTGNRQFTLMFRNLITGQALPEQMQLVESFTWAADSKTLFYVVQDSAKRPYRVLRHTLGQPVAKDPIVYEEKDARFEIGVGRTRSRRFIELDIGSHTSSETRFLEAAKPMGAFKVLRPRVPEVIYDVSDHGDSLLVHVNDRCRTNRLIEVPLAKPTAPGRELIPCREQVALESVDVFRDFYVVHEQVNGLPQLRAVDFKSGKESAFEMKEEDYYLGSAGNPEWDTGKYRYAYTSLVTPWSTFERDLATGEVKFLKAEPVPGYDASKYETKRLWVTASDGVKVPVSLAMRRGVKADGSNPLYLEGYGAYGMSSDVGFSSEQVSMLDRGVILATAHIRGGGEFGKPWHDAGRMKNKQRTFDDFIDTAKFLIEQKFTSEKRLAISGASAGGLLMGAVLNQHPELFRVAHVGVPFVDVINTMLDESVPLTVGEFEEWGNPKVKAEYDVMAAYSPYENLKAQAYPSILVTSSYNDSQVMYHEPAKWVARLRTLKTDQNPLLLKMEMSPAGHSGRSGRFDGLEDDAFEMAFMLRELGATQLVK